MKKEEEEEKENNTSPSTSIRLIFFPGSFGGGFSCFFLSLEFLFFSPFRVCAVSLIGNGWNFVRLQMSLCPILSS